MTKTLDDVVYLNIFYLKKLNKLSPGSIVLLHWFKGIVLVQSTKLFIDADGVDMVGGKIYFERTPCYFGGERLWFKCPACKKRCGVLYGQDFVCRKCIKLNYGCQHEDEIGKLQRKISKLLVKFDHGMPALRPKNQHKRTYNKNKYAYNELLLKENKIWAGYVSKLKSQLININ